MLIGQEKQEKIEQQRLKDEDEQFKQEVIETAKSVRGTTVAVGSAAVGAVGAAGAVGTGAIHGAECAAKVTAQSALRADEATRHAAGGVAQVAQTLGDAVGDLVIQKLAPDDLLGMYRALGGFLEVPMTHVVDGVPLVKIKDSAKWYAKTLLKSYPSRAAAVKAMISGSEDSPMQILADG